MSHIVKINEYLDEKIKSYKDRLDVLSGEYCKTNDHRREMKIISLMDQFTLVITELNEVVKRVNGV